METTFISIHDLSLDARILYSSDSVIDILGYTPDEIVNRSAWEFFPMAEIASAQKVQQKRIATDKAAVLAYCHVADKKGFYVGCEVCFTVVYDVMVVCTSVYRQGIASDRRALEAPIVRRIFSSSPRDPRYHMLSHLSHKFTTPQKSYEHEPRAALFLNRFTRTLSIMYATNSIEEIIGISADALRGRSFYYCITENCLQDAVKCLENAKGNDSIAYLRFWFRDPRRDDRPPPDDGESDMGDDDVEMTTHSEEADESVSVSGETSALTQSDRSDASNVLPSPASMDLDQESHERSRTSSGDSTRSSDTHEAIFGQVRGTESSTSSLAPSPIRTSPAPALAEPIELEAVVSCASDGLVVCLRKARPMVPHVLTQSTQNAPVNGIFAAPWAFEPTLPPYERRATRPTYSNFAPSLGPRNAISHPPLDSGPERSDFMNSIREQAVFAWALTGINGSMAAFGKGKPRGEALPADGLPIWSSDPRLFRSGAGGFDDDGRLNLALFGDPGLARDRRNSRGSHGTSGSVASPDSRSPLDEH